MAKTPYGERDYAFGQMILTLRTAIGLTQGALAERLGVSRRAVAEWEAGNSYPKAEHLQQLIALAIDCQIFAPGQEGEQAHALWKAAHQKILFDERWFSSLLAQKCSTQPCGEIAPIEKRDDNAETLSAPGEETLAPLFPGPQIDWGESLALPTFYGREEELTLLMEWIVQEHCRVVSILGMGGIGKSALAVSAMYRMAEHFEVVIWRSLRDAPSCEALLADCLQVLSPQIAVERSASLDHQIRLLLTHFRQRHILIILDNLESILEEKDARGRYRAGYEGYSHLLRRIAEREHQGCLVLTSREKPMELRPLEGKRSPVRSLRLVGLDTAACRQLFADKGVVGTFQEQARLAEAYTGNPLALKIVTETIYDLFNGEIGQFFQGKTLLFGSIFDLIGEQFSRLPILEQTVMRWLAIMREPVTIEELLAVLITPFPRIQVLEALDNLRRRSLIERGQREASFALQLVVSEYVTAVFLHEAADEIQQQRLDVLVQYALAPPAGPKVRSFSSPASARKGFSGSAIRTLST